MSDILRVASTFIDTTQPDPTFKSQMNITDAPLIIASCGPVVNFTLHANDIRLASGRGNYVWRIPVDWKWKMKYKTYTACLLFDSDDSQKIMDNSVIIGTSYDAGENTICIGIKNYSTSVSLTYGHVSANWTVILSDYNKK